LFGYLGFQNRIKERKEEDIFSKRAFGCKEQTRTLVAKEKRTHIIIMFTSSTSLSLRAFSSSRATSFSTTKLKKNSSVSRRAAKRSSSNSATTTALTMGADEKRTIGQLETEDAFIKVINSEGIHVVEFVAGWCRKCKTLNGKMEYFAVEHPEISFDKIDVNMVPQEFIKSQNVTKMPTVKIFVSGKSVYEKVGFETVREILEELNFRLKQLEEESALTPPTSK
jgi:thiol-disulfide isomerase/thioredoxin